MKAQISLDVAVDSDNTSPPEAMVVLDNLKERVTFVFQSPHRELQISVQDLKRILDLTAAL